MKTIQKLFLFLFASTLLSSCNVNMFNSVSGNKNVITQDRTTKEEFTKIQVSTGLDLYITQGDTKKIILEADENLHEFINTEIKDGILKIYSEKNIWNAEARKIHVTIPNLELVSAVSGANVYTENTLNVDSINVICTTGAVIKMSLNANSVQSSATTGSDIELMGNANQHTSSATTGASIDAYKLLSKNTSANVTSGAEINVYASETIDAVATSGGDIDFKGNPKKVNKQSSSGGSISAK